MKNKIGILILFVTFLFMSYCCNKVFTNEKFTLKKTPFLGKELRIDGYYYKKYKNTGYEPGVTVYLLYKNGVSLNANSFDDTTNFEKLFKNGAFYNTVKNNPNVWGLFNIDSSTIKIEAPNPQGGPAIYQYIYLGTILNDTTIHFTKYMSSDGSRDVQARNDTFHFKQFSPKPDSTNKYTQ